MNTTLYKFNASKALFWMPLFTICKLITNSSHLCTLCAFLSFLDINITTKDNVNHFLQQYRLDIHNSTSIYFKVKSCNRVSIGLLEKGTNVKYIVNSGKTHLTIQKYPYDILPLHSVASWSGMNCSCYISLWISWLDRQIAIGKGTMIGTDICNKLTISSTTDINVDDIYLKSFSAAYWLFDFSQNATAGKYFYNQTQL